MHTLSNDLLSIRISPTGAELQSLLSIRDNVEYLWQGDPEIWSGRAPILFPIVGALRQGRFEFAGESYQLPRHGLARKSDFKRITSTPDSAVFQWQSDTQTRKCFPWDFLMLVGYSIDGNRVVIDYQVENTNQNSMQFTIGSHPAFTLVNPVECYHIKFSDKEELTRYPLTEDGLLNRTGKACPLVNHSIPLTQSLFDEDALIFKHINSKTISLYDREQEMVRVYTGGAPHLGLWAKPAAPFVCIEPWFGYSDDVDATGKWRDKPAMLSLQPGETFTHQWVIEVPSIGG